MSLYEYLTRTRVTNQLTCGDEDHFGHGVDDGSGGGEDNRATTVSKGCVNSPALIRRIGPCDGTVQAKMSSEISSIILLRHLQIVDLSCEFAGISITKLHLAVCDEP